jgi:hypothetical protein
MRRNVPKEARRGIEPLRDCFANSRLSTWLPRRGVDPGRLELPISSLRARRFPSKPQAHIACWVRGAGSNRRSPGSQSGALPLSYREQVPAPCQGFEPRSADSESAVLPLDEHGMCFVRAPGEIRTPDLPGRSRPLYPLNYGRIGWVAGEGLEPSPWWLWATRSRH